jgi:O-antigen ligase
MAANQCCFAMQASEPAVTSGGLWKDNLSALAIASAGAILGASLLYTSLPFLLLLVVPGCFYFISRPYELLLVMVFLIPFNFVFTIGSIPVAVELLKIVLWIPFLLNRLDHGNKLRTSRYNWCFGILVGLSLLSIFRSQDLPFTVKEVVRFGSNIGLYYLVLNLVDSREKVTQILRVLIVSVFFVACYGFYQFAIQDFGGLFWIVNPRLDTSLAHARNIFYPWRNRMISVLTSEMEMGHYFNLCLPIAVALWLTEGRGRLYSKWLLIALAIFAGLLLTFTFAAWLALAATATLFILLTDKKRRWKVVFGELLAVVLAVLLCVYGPLEPMVEGKLFGSSEASLGFDMLTRIRMWIFAVQTWWSHPFIGVGLGNYQNLSWVVNFGQTSPTSPDAGSTPHQFYLNLLVAFGLVGTICVMLVMLYSIRTNLALRANAQFGLVALALAFAITTNIMGGFGDDSNMFSPHAGYLLWLLLGLSETLHILLPS